MPRLMREQSAVAFKIAAPAVKNLIGERTVRERLVKLLKKKLKEIPDTPDITWATQRGPTQRRPRLWSKSPIPV